jgi:hypothetical protein
MTKLYSQDHDLVIWWGTPVECVSAIARREREHGLTAVVVQKSLARLAQISSQCGVIQPVDAVKDLAIRLLRVHPLRAADCLQLSAAILASEHQPSSLEFVCLDARLSLAAERESFSVVSP